jgi:hypothetical protein
MPLPDGRSPASRRNYGRSPRVTAAGQSISATSTRRTKRWSGFCRAFRVEKC